LESLAHRSRTHPQLARRARLVLLCGEGLASNVVARKLRVRDQTVSKWRGRFVRDRLAGLYDEPRPGAPRTITDADVERVVTRTLDSPPRGHTHWSLRGREHRSFRPEDDGRPSL
jgi:transposase